MGRRAVVFDRDGTLIEEVGYLDSLDRIRFFPWTVEALRVLHRAGYRLVVVTNQAGVARGFFDEAFVERTHRWLAERFRAAGVEIERFYYCPHHPDGQIARYRQECECRKPRPGMLRRAERELGLDLAGSFVVGDRWLDVELAQRAGARGILVRTGFGETESRHPPSGVSAAAIVPHAFAAADWILRHGG